jgi:peptidoglycan hydrolase CwlO-like protein
MTREEQIAAIRARLAEVDGAIAQLRAALPGANEDQRRQLEARIAELEQTRVTLQTMLNNLQGGVTALAFAGTPAAARRKLASHNTAMVRAAKESARATQTRAKETVTLLRAPAKKKPRRG